MTPQPLDRHSNLAQEVTVTDVCDDCADDAERAAHDDLRGLEGPALHIAVGILYGSWACDHVEYEDQHIAEAYGALYAREVRRRDIMRAGLNALEREVVREYGISATSDFVLTRIAAIFSNARLPR